MTSPQGTSKEINEIVRREIFERGMMEGENRLLKSILEQLLKIELNPKLDLEF
jgi:hypothetical protein